ncbi:MAG: aspartate aminotransferase family protein [Micrococcales bacterium]|nr:aspartate aminotransferase family protein [Micrococcales bacterium]
MATKESKARKLAAALKPGKAPASKPAEAKADQATPLLDARKAGREATNFTRHSPYQTADMPIIAKAEGHHFWDANGKKYFDGISSLFSVNVGHGRARLAEAAAKQMKQLDYFPIWSHAHAPAIELAERVLSYAPKSLNRVFFTTGGGEANETAWKLAKQYFKLTGKPTKHKVISRAVAYHGTSHGALSLTGIPSMKKMYEPLVPSTFRVPNTNWYRAQEDFETEEDFALWAANRVEEMILFEDPDTVAAFIFEPVQNSGGCFTAPKSYFKRVREICDKYDVLLIADETIDGFGRIGTMFASEFYELEPDMLVCAKGITSAYAPLGALLLSERLFEPFKHGTTIFSHGYTFAGHPVSCAVALENLDIFDEEDLVGNVRRNSPAFRKTLEKLKDLPIVGDVRGEGYFFAIELVRDKNTKESFNDEESEKLLRQFLSHHLYDNGLYCRSDDRGDPVVQLAPPLTIGQKEFDELEQTLRHSLSIAGELFELM